MSSINESASLNKLEVTSKVIKSPTDESVVPVVEMNVENLTGSARSRLDVMPQLNIGTLKNLATDATRLAAADVDCCQIAAMSRLTI